MVEAFDTLLKSLKVPEPSCAVELFVNAVVPTRQTVLVAQTQAPQALSAGTPCVFLIEGAVRPAAP